MTYSNTKMRELMRPSDDKPEYLAMVDKQLDKLFKDLRYENECLFLSTHNGPADPSVAWDKTRFEADCNEILINRLFPKKNVTAAFAVTFHSFFIDRLAFEYPYKFCAILSEDNGWWTFRFHIVRKDEKPWLGGDLEKFAQPVMYDVFGGENDRL